MSDLPVAFPVAVDSDHAIWRAFRNQYWPALYFIDAKGRIRYHQFGEGGFVEAERVIQQLSDLHLVMKPSAQGTPVRFRIPLDGQPPGPHGVDVDEQGNGTVTEPRLYQLVRQPGAIGDRLFEIEFLDPGIEVFAFTFG